MGFTTAASENLHVVSCFSRIFLPRARVHQMILLFLLSPAMAAFSIVSINPKPQNGSPSGGNDLLILFLEFLDMIRALLEGKSNLCFFQQTAAETAGCSVCDQCSVFVMDFHL